MAISYFLDLARSGLCLPMATDLVLNEDPYPEATRRDGFRLGQVVERSAWRRDSSVALPLMDLRLDRPTCASPGDHRGPGGSVSLLRGHR